MGLAIASALVLLLAVPGAWIAIFICDGSESANLFDLLLLVPPLVVVLLAAAAILPGRSRLGTRPGDWIGVIAGLVGLLILFVNFIVVVASAGIY